MEKKILKTGVLHKAREWTIRLLAMANAKGSHERSSRSNTFLICLIIFLVAIGIRLLYLQDNSLEIARLDSNIFGIRLLYQLEAQRINNQSSILFPSDPVDPGDARLIVHPPGYSILMAAIYRLFGESEALLILRQVKIIIDSVSVVVVFLIAIQILPRGVAIIAALLAALSPHFAYYSIWHSPDSLASLPILLAILFVIRAINRPRFITIFAAGAMVGLSCWLRSNPLMLAPMLAIFVFLLIERDKRVRYTSAFIAAAILVIAPITIRNWVVYRQFIPLSIGAGITLAEGIGEYDKEGRWGMPAHDGEALQKDIEWHDRPDYGDDLWKPDGIERDNERFARGLAVIRSDPWWFSKVMLSRMAFMLRYNDFRRYDTGHISIAPTLSAEPGFGSHPSDSNLMTPVWSESLSELLTNDRANRSQPDILVTTEGQTLLIAGEKSVPGDQVYFGPIPVNKNINYVLTLKTSIDHGSLSVKITDVDPRIILGWVDTDKKRLKKKLARDLKDARDQEIATDQAKEMAVLHIPFPSGKRDMVLLAISGGAASSTKFSAHVEGAELFEIGPTPHVWTSGPRMIVQGLQKNLFKTDHMRLLILCGITLLLVSRRKRDLVILLAVPIYFLLVQSFLHTEYRYILVIHYFLFIIAAVTIYGIGAIIGQSSRSFWKKLSDRYLSL
jgi:hypothetical protein